jgi:hypothetical protein
MTAILAPLLLGFAFGFVLQKGGLTQYRKVSGVFTFGELTVLKFLLSALITGAVAVRVLQSAGVGDLVPVTNTYLLGNAVGGLLHGVGMALLGFCPGTVLAGAGEGRLDNLVFGVSGLFAGALAFGWAWPAFFPALSRVGALGRVTLGEVLHASPALLVLVFALVVAIIFYLVERGAGHGKPARSH